MGKFPWKIRRYLKGFLFTCKKFELTNVLNFDELCSKETILFLKKRSKELQKAEKE